MTLFFVDGNENIPFQSEVYDPSAIYDFLHASADFLDAKASKACSMFYFII